MSVRVLGTRHHPPGPRSAPLRELDRPDGAIPRQCRFPVGDTPEDAAQAAEQLFCGEAAEPGCPYCRAHRRTAYRGRVTPSDLEALIVPRPRRRAA